MQKLAVAAVSTALFVAGLSAADRQSGDAQTFHRAEVGDRASLDAVGDRSRDACDRFQTQIPAKPAAGAASAISVDAQNKLVGAELRELPQRALQGRRARRSPASTPRRSTERPDVAEKMIRKLRAGMMPPPGARRPDAATHRRRSSTRSKRRWTPRRRSTRIRAGVRSSA